MSRRHLSARNNAPKPLIALAGLPNLIMGKIKNDIEETISPSPHVISLPSGNNDNALYSQNTVAALLRAISSYAIRQQRAHSSISAPKHILLAYVPSADDENLLSQFDFFVYPIRLTRMAEYSPSGQQFRHDRKSALQYVPAVIKQTIPAFNVLQRRLFTFKSSEPFLLPPVNFKITSSQKLTSFFLELRREQRPWSDTLDELKSTKVTGREFPHNFRRKERKVVYVDCRKLHFPVDPSRHGLLDELDNDCGEGERQQFLRSAFRFGVPIRDGFHHDAQFIKRDLDGVEFECCRSGDVVGKGSHANIYPNDYVRL